MPLLVALFFVLLPFPARAYLDPGTGSVLLQILLTGVAGLAVMLKLYWRKLKALFGRAPPREDPTRHG